MVLQLLHTTGQIFFGSMAFFGSMLVCYRLYGWSNKSKHDVKYKDASDPSKGLIYLVDESIDKKVSVMDIVAPTTDAFDKPQKINNMIKKVDPNTTIKLVINTAGGNLFACHKILDKLTQHPAGYVAYIRNESMSAGTIIALGAKEIVMCDDSYLGKIDPQVSDGKSYYAAINYYDLDTFQEGKCLEASTIGDYRTSLYAMNYLKELLDKIISDKTLLDNINREMIYSKLPHLKKFSYQDCLDMGLPIRKPETEEEISLLSE